MGVRYVEKVEAHQSSPLWEHNTADLVAFAREEMFAGATVLDYGCGTGRLTAWLDDFSRHVSGVDPDIDMIERARRKYPKYKFWRDDSPMRSGDGTFDAVVASNVLGHAVNLETVLWDLVRVTKVGGHVIVLNANVWNTIVRAPANKLKGYRSDATIQQRFSRSWLANAMALLGARQTKSMMTGEQLLVFRSPLDAVFISVFKVTRQVDKQDFHDFIRNISKVPGLFYCNS